MRRVLMTRWRPDTTDKQKATIIDHNANPSNPLDHSAWDYLVQVGEPPEVEMNWISADEYWEGAKADG